MKLFTLLFVLSLAGVASAETTLYVIEDYNPQKTSAAKTSTLEAPLAADELIKKGSGFCYEGLANEAIDIMQSMIDTSGAAMTLSYTYEQDHESVGDPLSVKNLIVSWKQNGSQKFVTFEWVRSCSRVSK